MTEAIHIPAWGQKGNKDRVASTRDIREELRQVKHYSFEEFSLCFEAALDGDRPLSERERYLLARFGKEYADSPDAFNKRLDNLEQRLAANMGEFVLIQKSPTFVFIERLASPNLKFITKISINGKPYGAMMIETSSSISTIIDSNYEIVPELTRDFVDVRPGISMIAEGTTAHNLAGFDRLKDEWVLDPEKPYIHEGDEYVVCVGLEEIQKWQRNNLKWAPLVQDMMEAWNTGLINLPAARIKQRSGLGESSLNLIGDEGPTQSLVQDSSS